MNIWDIYQQIPEELRHGGYTPAERGLIAEYYSEVGLLRWHRRPYFRRHFAESIKLACAYLGNIQNKQPLVLDLGAGLGTQAICFALTGYKVVAVDMDESVLRLLMKRAAYYAKLYSRPLDLRICVGDALTVDFSRLGRFDAVFSLFAFNLMRPSGQLLDRLLPAMRPGARMIVIDGNRLSWLSRLVPSFRRAVWSPIEFQNEIIRRRFIVDYHRGGVALPPALFRLIPYRLANALDEALCANWMMPISHVILARLEG
jgi:SAM-dependent methyltransferase